MTEEDAKRILVRCMLCDEDSELILAKINTYKAHGFTDEVESLEAEYQNRKKEQASAIRAIERLKIISSKQSELLFLRYVRGFEVVDILPWIRYSERNYYRIHSRAIKNFSRIYQENAKNI